MSGLIGNTVVEVGNGIDAGVTLHADGTYAKDDVCGVPSKGTWKDVNGEVCYMQADPQPKPGEPAYLCVEGLDGSQFRGPVVAGQ
ncbi:MAG: hypothetical protein WDM77_21590 [Steroidobacteraceae bacterium]